MCLDLVKNALVILLLMVATGVQPMLAIPASCQMQGERQAMSCAGCCAVQACCAPSERQESSPLAAVLKSNGDFVPAITWQPVAVPLPVVRHIQYPTIARLFAVAHAPSPLALNCIQLI
jgi:hypothetical protein